MDSLTRIEIYESGNDSECEQEVGKPEKRLPVPEFCRSTPDKKPSKEENHEGKIRNFPHEPGNWATYVYLPVESSPKFLKYLSSLTEFFEPLNLKVVDDFHISLTKTVVLKHHWIQHFVNSVKNGLININSFKIHLLGLKVFLNEQKTRTFLSLVVDEGQENLKAIINQLDNCLQEYNLPTFYKDPAFHLSLFWCAGDKYSEINKFLSHLPPKLDSFGFYVNISNCICASGVLSNRAFVVQFDKENFFDK